jgi:glycosyltransferase involved in cell wall biosynthesis
MKKILLFLTTDFTGGGASQYEYTILQGVLNLPKEDFELIFMYADKVWENYLPQDGKCIKINLNQFNKRLIQLLITIKFPIRILRYLLIQLDPIVKLLNELKLDLVFVPSQETFWSYIVNVPSLGVIHDLMHRYERFFPEVSKNSRFFYRDNHFYNICRHSIGVIVDSEFGKKQVLESYEIPVSKIFVLPFVPPGYVYNTECHSDVKTKYHLPNRYIFYPAQFWQHKNHERLIRAISMLVNDLPDIQLVLVGSQQNSYHRIKELISSLNLKERIHILGFVPNEDMCGLYKGAKALVMPTFFGPTNIPPLEAFAIGCPVGVSNVYGIAEQVEDAALLFDPNSVDEIANVIKLLWTDDDLCKELMEKGKKVSQKWGPKEFNLRLIKIINTVTDHVPTFS